MHIATQSKYFFKNMIKVIFKANMIRQQALLSFLRNKLYFQVNTKVRTDNFKIKN